MEMRKCYNYHGTIKCNLVNTALLEWYRLMDNENSPENPQVQPTPPRDVPPPMDSTTSGIIPAASIGFDRLTNDADLYGLATRDD